MLVYAGKGNPMTCSGAMQTRDMFAGAMQEKEKRTAGLGCVEVGHAWEKASSRFHIGKGQQNKQ